MPDLVKYKRGVSSTIAIVLLILVVISAAGLLYSFVVKTTSRITNLSPQDCIDMQSKQILRINEAKYLEVSSDLLINLFRLSYDNSIDSITFKLYYDDGNSKSFECGKCSSCSILDKGLSKGYLINTLPKPIKLDILSKDCPLINNFKIN